MLKPCKVKRFLATDDLSVVGLVTGSSGSNGVKWAAKRGGKRSQADVGGGGDEEERSQVSES